MWAKSEYNLKPGSKIRVCYTHRNGEFREGDILTVSSKYWDSAGLGKCQWCPGNVNRHWIPVEECITNICSQNIEVVDANHDNVRSHMPKWF